MSEKRECGHSDGECKRRRIYRRIIACILFLITLILLTVLIIWLVLRPTRPRFYLQDVSVAQLNLTVGAGHAALLTTVLQVTIASRNPNDRIGIYYNRLTAFAHYHSQQITSSTVLPPVVLPTHEEVVWSPFISGAAVPLDPYLANALFDDKKAGYVLLSVRVDGRLRWKVGTWVSGRYHLHVSCPVLLMPIAGSYGGYRFQQGVRCSVDV